MPQFAGNDPREQDFVIAYSRAREPYQASAVFALHHPPNIRGAVTRRAVAFPGERDISVLVENVVRVEAIIYVSS